MALIKQGEGYLGTQVSKETKDFFLRLKEEKGIPLSHIFLLGLFKALPDIAPDVDPLDIPEIEKLTKHGLVWESLKKDIEGEK